MFTLSLRVFPLLLLLYCHFVSAQIPSSGCKLKAPAPANTICGKTGDTPVYAQPGNLVFASQTLSNITECQNLCLRRAGSGYASCVSFSYDSSSSLCKIAPQALKSISESATSKVIFYERSCFTCPQSCSQQAVGQDLLDNSGFEISPTYLGPWYSSGGKNQGIQSGGDASKRSYFCTAGATSKCSILQSFYSCNTTVYKWSYDYKAEYKKFDSFYATASYTGGASHSMQYPNNSAATLKWQTYTDVFQLNSNVTSAAMAFNLQPGKTVQGKTGRTFLVDNIRLEPTDYVVGPEPGAYNSLPGGDFEKGTLAPWTKTKQSEDLTIVSPGIMGNYALKWSFKGGQKNPSFGIEQDLSVVKKGVTQPGMAYLFNVDYVNNLPQGHGVRPLLYAKFEMFTGTNDSITNIHNVYTQYHDGQESTIRIPFQGQVNQFFTRMTITVVSEVPEGDYHIIVDDISFKPLYTASSSDS